MEIVTISKYMQKHKITSKAVLVKIGLIKKDWNNQEVDQWKIEFTKQGIREEGNRKMTVDFYCGIGHRTEEGTPKPVKGEDVLNSLASDSSGFANCGGDFEEWAKEYGYDTDSRTAERIFKAIEHQKNRLLIFLGNIPNFDELVYSTERL